MASLEHEVIVCYDVEDNKTRRKLSEALKDIGLMPVQKSVFWGHLRPAEERAVMREFDNLLDSASDRAFIARINLTDVCKQAAFGYDSGILERTPDYAAL